MKKNHKLITDIIASRVKATKRYYPIRILKLKIKKWIYKHYVERYICTLDAEFIDLYVQKNYSILPSRDIRSENYNRIMKNITSIEYKNFFYRVVNCNKIDSRVIIKPYGNKFIDKVNKLIAKVCLYLFDIKLYQKLKLFLSLKNKSTATNSQVDEYMNITDGMVRIDRARMRRVISVEKSIALTRLFDIKWNRISIIKTNNKYYL